LWTVASLVVSVKDTRRYPGGDLRAKIVGSRLLVAKRNPYQMVTEAEKNDYYRASEVAFSSPAVLAVYVPLQAVPYRLERVFYFCLDWLLAGTVFFLLARFFCRTRGERLLCWLVYAVFVPCSYSFRLHLERGQYYMMLLTLTCVAAVCIQRRQSGWLACCPVALLILMRPTYALLLVAAYFAFGQRRWAWRSAALTAVLFLLTLPLGGWKSWSEFNQAVKDRQTSNFAEMSSFCSGPAARAAFLNASDSAPPPVMIDGLDFSQALSARSVNATVDGLLTMRTRTTAKHPAVVCRFYSPAWLGRCNTLGTLLVLLAGGVFLLLARGREISANVLLASALVWPLLLELFLPERFFYSAVIEVLPLLLLVLDRQFVSTEAPSPGRLRWLEALLLLALVPVVLFQLLLRSSIVGLLCSIVIEVLLPVALALFCAGVILAAPKRASQANEAGATV
jgi:hypothetical protein